jgi:hypothetical protein
MASKRREAYVSVMDGIFAFNKILADNSTGRLNLTQKERDAIEKVRGAMVGATMRMEETAVWEDGRELPE